MIQDLKATTIVLTVSFLIFCTTFAGLIARVIPPEGMAGLTLLVGGLAYHISLGILAVKKGRSPIKWVGLSMLTSPFGLFVSFFMMLNAKSLKK